MKEPRHDDERLAALLEGRLEGPERDELLAYLAAADEDFQVFARTAAVLREMEEEEAQAQQLPAQADHPPVRETIPPSARPGWRRRTPRWAVAAALVGLVVLGFLTTRGLRPAPDPLRVAVALRDGERLPADWREPAWNTSRGGGPDGRKEDAARAGSMLMDLAVAARAGDAESIRSRAQRIQQRFEPQGGSALAEIQRSSGRPYTELEPLLKQATERLEEQLDREHLRLGAWAEAARLAAHGQDTAFFRSDETRAMLRRAARLTRDDAAARGAVSRIRAATAAEGAPDWRTLEADATVLLTEIAS